MRYDLQKVKILKRVQDDRLCPSPRERGANPRQGVGVRYDLQKVKILKLVQDDRLYPSLDLKRAN